MSFHLAKEGRPNSRQPRPRRRRAATSAYLPQLPLDPFDGKPLRYIAPKSESEQPLLYSVGVDGVDERGRLPVTEGGRFGVHHLGALAKFRAGRFLTNIERQSADASRGDWVLWPEPPPLIRQKLPDTNPANAHLQE